MNSVPLFCCRTPIRHKSVVLCSLRGIPDAQVVPVGGAMNLEHAQFLKEVDRPPREGKLAIVISNSFIIGYELGCQEWIELRRCDLVAIRLLCIALPGPRRVFRPVPRHRVRRRAIDELLQSPLYGEPGLGLQVYVMEPPRGAGVLDNGSCLICLLSRESRKLSGYQVVVSVESVHGVCGCWRIPWWTRLLRRRVSALSPILRL